ncbi:MAG: ATP synthase F1 subunit delta [Thermodesulfovibrionales bacterium]|nr:ATP synthase F1 subunit delta [Thermodesulfovibrionales bacterium]
MKKVKGVKRYAKQFLSVTEMANVPKAIEQLNAIAHLIQVDRGFKNLMISPVFDDGERQKTIVYVSQKIGASEKLVKYLKYLGDEKVIDSMPDIIKSIMDMYLEMKKRAKAVVTTSVQISRDYEVKLAEAFKQITGRDIDLEVVIDPSLIGGVSIKVGSAMYDSSIKGQLKLLRNRLIGQ